MGVMAGKWIGFSHIESALTRLFPHKSTQVVDFPRMAMVNIFLGKQLTAEAQSQAKLGTNMVKLREGAESVRMSQAGKRHERGKWRAGGRLEAGFREKRSCSITRIYTHLHDFTQRSFSVTLRGPKSKVRSGRSAGFAYLGVMLCGVTGRSSLHKFAKVAFCKSDLQ